MMTDWLCRQGEHGKIELEDTQTAVEMLRGMMVMDTQRAVMRSTQGHKPRIAALGRRSRTTCAACMNSVLRYLLPRLNKSVPLVFTRDVQKGLSETRRRGTA